MSPLQIILIGLIFIVVLGAGLFFVRAQEAERKKRLLGVVQGSGALKAQNPALSEKDAQNKRRADIAKKLKGSKDGEAGAATAGHKKKPAFAGQDCASRAFFFRCQILDVVCCFNGRVCFSGICF
ncbi:MAG: hypothetical protein LRY54_04305 [Alphaproteobacteria bacterium]|nr:hypothetical protein [Alphaproteobacteria bacterium]